MTTRLKRWTAQLERVNRCLRWLIDELKAGRIVIPDEVKNGTGGSAQTMR